MTRAYSWFFDKTKRFSGLANEFYESREFLWLLISLGVILRVKQYLHNKSLWQDEASLALNLLNRDFVGLMQPLDYYQAAPVGFLMLEKLTVELLGSSEYSLRLLPLISGIVCLILFYWVARRYLPDSIVPLAIGLFAISEYLVFYSSELKQYMTDVMIVLVLLLLADNVLSHKSEVKSIVIFGIAGAIAIWFSHVSIFFLAGIGVTLIFFYLQQRCFSGLLRVAIMGLFWLVSLFANYVLFLRTLENNAWLMNWWRNSFMPFPPLAVSDLKWFYEKFFEIFETPLDFRIPGIAALALLVGCYVMFQRKRWQFFFVVTPIFFALLASGLHKFPFYGRLLLFLIPSLIILIVAGTQEVIEATRSRSPSIGAIFLILLLIYPVRSAGYFLMRPFYRAEMQSVVQCISQHHLEQDILYLHMDAETAFRYYSERYGLSDDRYVIGTGKAGEWEQYTGEIEMLIGNERVWFIFSLHAGYSAEQRDFFLNYLDRIGKRLRSCHSPGAAAYLYDLET